MKYKRKNIDTANEPNANNTDNNKTKIQLFSFSGKQSVKLLSKMKKQLNESIPSNVKTCIIYEGARLSTQFPMKDKTRFEHRHNVVYFSHNVVYFSILYTLVLM